MNVLQFCTAWRSSVCRELVEQRYHPLKEFGTWSSYIIDEYKQWVSLALESVCVFDVRISRLASCLHTKQKKYVYIQSRKNTHSTVSGLYLELTFSPETLILGHIRFWCLFVVSSCLRTAVNRFLISTLGYLSIRSVFRLAVCLVFCLLLVISGLWSRTFWTKSSTTAVSGRRVGRLRFWLHVYHGSCVDFFSHF